MTDIPPGIKFLFVEGTNIWLRDRIQGAKRGVTSNAEMLDQIDCRPSDINNADLVVGIAAHNGLVYMKTLKQRIPFVPMEPYEDAEIPVGAGETFHGENPDTDDPAGRSPEFPN